MTAVEQTLAELGDLLQLDDDLVAEVMADVEQAGRAGRSRSALKAAAVIAVVAAAVVALVPSTRDAVADWLGLDRVTIDRRDDLDLDLDLAPPTATSPGPFDARTDTVDGQRIEIMRIDGELTDGAIRKTVGGSAQVVPVAVDGNPGLWIPELHELMIEQGGLPVFERVAANTLVWQDGDVLWRIEGFARMGDAIRYAESL